MNQPAQERKQRQYEEGCIHQFWRLQTYLLNSHIWNHDFYWRSMEPGGGGKPPERLLKFINGDFGSYDGMIQQFMDAALTQFGETEQITNVSEYEKHCFSSVLQIYQCLYGCLHQVYKDRNMVRQLVQRAEMAGFKAIALTVDTQKLHCFSSVLL